MRRNRTRSMSDLKNQKEQATTSRDILPQRDESPVPLVSFTPKLIASIPKRRLNCSEPSSSISLSGTLPKFALKRPSFIKLTLKQGGPQDQTDETSEYNLSQESRRIPFLTKSEVSTKQLTSSICSDTKLESTGESLQKRKEDCSLTTVGHELGQAGSPVFQPKPYYLNPNSLGEQQLREAHFREDPVRRRSDSCSSRAERKSKALAQKAAATPEQHNADAGDRKARCGFSRTDRQESNICQAATCPCF
jgi:hypothetical protein